MARFKFISLILTTTLFFIASSASCLAFYLYASPAFYSPTLEEGQEETIVIEAAKDEPKANVGREIKQEEGESEGSGEMIMVSSGSGNVDAGVALRRRTSKKVSSTIVFGFF